MNRPHSFIGKTRDELDGTRWKKLGPAEKLLDFLKSRQTSPDGKVYYHKELGYAWIRSKIPNPPPQRTLQRWMGRLKELGEIEVRRMPYGGIRIRLLKSRKWAQQIKMFPEAGLPMPVENTNPLPPKVAVDLPPLLASERSYRNKLEETNNTPRAARAAISPVENGTNGPKKAKNDPHREWNRQQKARRILREIEVVRECYAGAYGDDLLRRDFKLGLLYDELERTGYQDARAG